MTESEVEPLAAFAEELAALRTRSGATLKTITQISGMHGPGLARSTIHQKLTGQTPPDWEFVEAFVRACASHASRAGRQLAAADVDIESWRIRHSAMVAALVSARPRRRGATAALRQTVETFDSQRASYQRNLIKRYRRLDLALLTPNEQDEPRSFLLRSMFIPQFVRAELQTADLPKEMTRGLAESGERGEADFPGGDDGRRVLRAGQSTRPPPEPVLRVLSDATRRLTVILGNPGFGKSTLAQYLAVVLAGEAHTDDVAGLAGWLPLLVELRSYAEPPWRDRTFLDFIEHLHDTEDRGLPKAPLDAYLRGDGRAVVVFDGLDELFDLALQDKVTRQIVAFAGRYPRVRIVVTSRPIGYRKALLDGAGFAHYTIEELDEDQIKQFVENWYTVACPDDPAEADRRRRRVLAAVAESPSLRELAGNPLLLTILTIIGRREELPRDRHRVYDHAAKVLVERWDVERYLRDSRVDTSFIESEDKSELLERIARRLQETRSDNTGNHISSTDLMTEFDNYIQGEYLLGPAQSKPVARAMIKQLHERNYILSHFGADIYGFVHRAFLEYFSAKDIVRRFRDKREWTPQELAIDVFGARWADPAWQEVLLLVVGMIDERSAAIVVDHLLSAHPLWFLDRDQQPRHLGLAIRCLGEVRKIGALTAQCQAATDAVISAWETLLVGQWEFIDYTRANSAAELISEAAMPVITAAGNRWPGRERYWSWLRRTIVRRRRRYGTSPLGSFSAELVRLAAAMGAGDPELRQLLVAMSGDVDEDARRAATQELVAGWADDPASPALLRQQAACDPDWYVRQSAVEALTTRYPADPATLGLLRTRATSEDDETVLAAVIKAVVTITGDEPATMSMLQELAGSADADTRCAVLGVLNDEWGSDPDVAMRLRESAVDDLHEQVRAFALGRVARDGTRDTEKPVWLNARMHDSHPWVRTAAIEALTVGHAAEDQNPELRESLRRSAVEDSDPDVRQAAIEAIASNWPGDPDTATWLRTLATGDDQAARLAVLKALQAGWAEDPATLALVTRQALHDPDIEVRRAAVDALIAQQRMDESALSLLIRLGTDHDVEVRRSAVEAVAIGWPGHDVVGTWLRERSDNDLDPVVRRTTMAALVTDCAGDPDTATWLRTRLLAEPDQTTQFAIVHALAAGWRHDQLTMSWLIERANADLRGDVRAAILTTITTAWPPRDEWLPFVREHASDDPDEDVRTAAIQVLAVGWLDEPGTLPLLHDRAVVDDAPVVRAAAILAIAAGGPGNPDTLRFLRERIGTDPDELVRQHVVYALRAGWLSDPEICRLLREMARSDSHEDVRRAAAEAVVAGNAGEPDVSGWLRTLATTDPHPAVRRIAVQAVGIGWHDEPETLPFLLDRAAAERDIDVRLIIANHLAIPINHAPLWLLQDLAVTAADPSDRRQVLQHVAAGWRHDPAVGAWLASRAIDDLHHEVRSAAVEAMIAGWQNDQKARSTIRDRADRDPHRDVRSRAADALRSLGP